MNEMTRWKVTDDPDLERQLRERIDDLGSREMAEFAHSLGLYPPGFGPTMNPPIALAWFPDMDFDEDGVIVWDVDEPEE